MISGIPVARRALASADLAARLANTLFVFQHARPSKAFVEREVMRLTVSTVSTVRGHGTCHAQPGLLRRGRLTMLTVLTQTTIPSKKRRTLLLGFGNGR